MLSFDTIRAMRIDASVTFELWINAMRTGFAAHQTAIEQQLQHPAPFQPQIAFGFFSREYAFQRRQQRELGLLAGDVTIIFQSINSIHTCLQGQATPDSMARLVLALYRLALNARRYHGDLTDHLPFAATETISTYQQLWDFCEQCYRQIILLHIDPTDRLQVFEQLVACESREVAAEIYIALTHEGFLDIVVYDYLASLEQPVTSSQETLLVDDSSNEITPMTSPLARTLSMSAGPGPETPYCSLQTRSPSPTVMSQT